MRALVVLALAALTLPPSASAQAHRTGEDATESPPAEAPETEHRPAEAAEAGPSELDSTQTSSDHTGAPQTGAERAPTTTSREPAPPADPPPRATEGAPQSPPPREPDEAEEPEDGDDPYDFLWIDLRGGISYVDLRALDASNYYPEFVRLSGTGPMAGLALGFRIAFFAAGVRATVASYGDGFDVGTATAEVKLILPIPIVKPWLRAGVGLGWHGDSNFNAPAESQTTVFGFAFNGATGIDIYLADWFSVGAALAVDVLNMNRQRTDATIDPADAGTIRFEETGDAVGIQIRGQAGVTFHL